MICLQSGIYKKAKFMVGHRVLAKEVDLTFLILFIHSCLISVLICYQNQNIKFGLFFSCFVAWLSW